MKDPKLISVTAVALFVTGCGNVTQAPSTSTGNPQAPPTALTIATTSLGSGTAGGAYTASIAATGGTTPYSFTAAGLPSGLSIGGSNGSISGTPTQTSVGTSVVSFSVSDSSQPAQTATAKLNITINPAASPSACSQISTGENASLNGYVPFPSTSPWNIDISNAPLDANNAAITSAAGFAGLHLHHDFSSTSGGNYGIPNVVVDSSATPSVPISVLDYADESDVASAPFPISAPIEGSPADCSGWPDTYVGDSHVLVLDRATCFLYETFNTHRCSGAWNSSSETIWDMQNYE